METSYKPSVIRTPDHRLKVFVSSTLKELAEERGAVRQAVTDLHFVPVMFESGARPHPAQELYRAYLAQSHVFIGLYWQSYGWVGPGMSVSGLEDEFNMSEGMPRLIYIKNPAPDRHPLLNDMLDRMKNKGAMSFKYFTTPGELKELVENDLALLMTEHFETARMTVPAEVETERLSTGNIPVPRNQLVGRESELAMVCNLLRQEKNRLVTLTGPGGTGKSRLAIQVALDLRQDFNSHTYLVMLSQVTDPEMVIPSIAQTLNIRKQNDGQPLIDTVAAYLHDRDIMLLLDNFEQVLDGGPFVAELSERCPRLKILVTSRAPLLLRGEKEVSIPPLEIPPDVDPDCPQDLCNYEAVELFLQRARDRKPDLEVSDADLLAIGTICKRLDGLPLAIELAAPRISLMTPRELLKRLDRRFDILKGGTRDLPERQQTMRATIDWSYHLLNESAKTLLRRLSVFSGNQWTLEDVEGVCNCHGDLDLLELMDILVKNSLLTRTLDPDGISHFGMLESIREYALERLTAHEECDLMHEKHAEYYLAFTKRIDPLLKSPSRGIWMKQLKQGIDNIRTCLEWCISDPRKIQIAQEIAVKLGWYIRLTGHLPEGQKMLDHLMAHIDDSTPLSIKGGMYWLAGGYAWAEGNFDKASRHLDESITISRSINDDASLVNALILRGLAAASTADLATATVMYEETIQLAHELNDLWCESLAYSWLGDVVLYQNDPERARQLHQTSIMLARKFGDPWCIASPLLSTGHIHLISGELETAIAIFDDAIMHLKRASDDYLLAWGYTGKGYGELYSGKLNDARVSFTRGMEVSRFVTNRATLFFINIGTAILMKEKPVTYERTIDAVRLCNVSLSNNPRQKLYYWYGWHEIFERGVKTVRDWVGEAAWKEGCEIQPALTVEEASSLAVKYLVGD